MIIEIKGTGTGNKGAEMMLLTILQELGSIDNVKFTISPNFYGAQYKFYSKLGIYPKVWLTYKGFQLGKFGSFIPKTIRTLYGLIIDEEVDVILDASGFSYSDQWGEGPSKKMAKEARVWKKHGKKIILMPQAFGPFENENNKKYMKEIIDNSHLIYARDKDSYNFLIDIVSDPKKIKLAPDFTILLKSELPTYFDKSIHQVCIVPNVRMLDKRADTGNYLKLLIKSIDYFQKNLLSPYFLIHGDSGDFSLAQQINKELKVPIPIVNEENPIFIKGMIKESIGLVGSRFHSIASALYSGTVAIGTGWSHKYQHLYSGFDFDEGLIDTDISDELLFERLNLIIDSDRRARKSQDLLDNAFKQKEKSVKLFIEIKNMLGTGNDILDTVTDNLNSGADK